MLKLKKIPVIIFLLCLIFMIGGLWQLERIKDMPPDPAAIWDTIEVLNQNLDMKGVQLFQRIEDAQTLLNSSGERIPVQLVEPPPNWKPHQFYYTFADLGMELETYIYADKEELIYSILTYNPELSIYGASPSKSVEENDRILIDSGFHRLNGDELGYLSMGEGEFFSITIENYDDSIYKSDNETAAKSVIRINALEYTSKAK